MPQIGEILYYKDANNSTPSPQPWAGNKPYGYIQISKEEFRRLADAIITTGRNPDSGMTYNASMFRDIIKYDDLINSKGIYAPTFKETQGMNIPNVDEQGYNKDFKPGFTQDQSGSAGAGGGSGTGGGSGGSGGGSSAPGSTAYKSSAAYKNLSSELQQLVDMAFSTLTGTEAEQKIFSDALTRAAAIADPYAKSQLALFKGEYMTKIADVKGDFETKRRVLEQTRKDLSETLRLNKDFLSLEEQSDIATQTGLYDEDMLTIADQAAEKGITFATGARSRALSEERRTEQFEDVIESTRRRSNFKIKELELRASQGDMEAAAQLKELPQKSGIKLTEIGQSAERILGSMGAGGLNIEGFKPVGDVLGDVEQQRLKDIITNTSAALPK